MTVTPGVLAGGLFVTLTLAVVTVMVLSDNAAYRRRLLEAVDARPAWRGRLLRAVDDRLRRTAWGRRLSGLLAGAGLAERSLAGSLLLVLLAATGAGLLMQPLVGRVGGVLTGVAVVMAARRWLERRRQQRITRFVGQLPEVARLLSNGASAGLGVRRSIELAVKELDEPARSELGQVHSELGLGQDLDTVLRHLSERLPSRELLVLVQTLVIQSRAGGALVSALSNIAATLDDRRQLRREIRTAVTGATFSGYAVGFVGIGSVLLMNMINPGALDLMVGTFLGQVALVVAGLLFLVGFLLVRRFSRIEL